jgi:hypothetical protein
MMSRLSKYAVMVVSVLIGVALEVGIEILSGRREAWDSAAYWTVGLPIAAALSLVVGFLSRGNAWIWTLLVVPSQILTMMVRIGEVGSLWPLAVVFGAILSAPFVLAAFIGSRFRTRGSSSADVSN